MALCSRPLGGVGGSLSLGDNGGRCGCDTLCIVEERCFAGPRATCPLCGVAQNELVALAPCADVCGILNSRSARNPVLP